MENAKSHSQLMMGFKLKKPYVAYSEYDKKEIKRNHDDNVIYAAKEDGTDGDLVFKIIRDEGEKVLIKQSI